MSLERARNLIQNTDLFNSIASDLRNAWSRLRRQLYLSQLKSCVWHIRDQLSESIILRNNYCHCEGPKSPAPMKTHETAHDLGETIQLQQDVCTKYTSGGNCTYCPWQFRAKCRKNLSRSSFCDKNRYSSASNFKFKNASYWSAELTVEILTFQPSGAVLK